MYTLATLYHIRFGEILANLAEQSRDLDIALLQVPLSHCRRQLVEICSLQKPDLERESERLSILMVEWEEYLFVSYDVGNALKEKRYAFYSSINQET